MNVSSRMRIPIALLAIAALACILGAVIEPERAAASWLTAYSAVLAAVLGMLLLIMIVEVSNGLWFAPFQPFAERVVGVIPVLAVLFLPVVLSAHLLYPWTTAPRDSELIALRRPYLSTPFALARVALYWIAWMGLAEKVRRAAWQRRHGVMGSAQEFRRISIVGIPILALTMTFAAFDWLMARSPEMSSSIYGFYFFAAGMVAALALLAVVGGLAVHDDERAGITAENLHAVGKLLVALLLVWIYIAYAQYLIIWIADLPREIPFYLIRTAGAWRTLGGILLFGHFAVPFVLLLPRAGKRSGLYMFVLGSWLLLMHYLNVYWLLMPAGTHTSWTFFWLDAAALLVVAGVAIGFSIRREGAGVRERTYAPAPTGMPIPGRRGHA